MQADLQRISFISFCDLQDEGSQNIKALAVADSLVPAGICQQYPL